VQEIVAFVEACGMEPAALDAQGCALIRCFMRRRRRQSDAEVHTAIIHLGDDATLLAITGAGHPLFMKQLPVGANQMFREIEQRLDLPRSELRFADDDEEAQAELAPRVAAALRLQLDSLCQELQACLRYHAASRRSPSGLELILSGSGTAIPGIAAIMSKTLGAPVQRSDPFTPAYTGLEPAAGLKDVAVWNVSLGLALREEQA
jgi:type IV pilus assembly protein PilM